MEENQWICSCGTENTGKFCSSCGRPKDAPTEYAAPAPAPAPMPMPTPTPADLYTQQMMQQMQMQMRQQEMMNQKQMELDAERRKKQLDYEHKRREYERECKEIPIRELKKWGSSWVVLVLAILSSVSLAASIATIFLSGTNIIASLVSSFIPLLLGVLVCIGFWRSYSAGKSSEPTFSAGGPKMLRGVGRFYQVITYICMIFVILAMIFLLIAGNGLLESLTKAAAEEGEDISWLTDSFTIVVVGALIGVIIAFVILILYYSSIMKFAKHAILCFETNCIPTQKVTMAAVFFFIIGIVTLIGSLSSIFTSSLLGEFANQIIEQGEIANELPEGFDVNSLFGINYFAIISQVVSAATSIFAGILAIQFNGLRDKITAEIAKIPEPELEF